MLIYPTTQLLTNFGIQAHLKHRMQEIQQYAEAEKSMLYAISISEKLKNYSNVNANYSNLCAVYMSTKQIEKAIKTTLDWAKYFHATVHFVHIETPEERDFGKNEYLFALKADATAPSVQHTVETIKSPSILEGLKYYAEKKAANIIVVVTKHRNFWKRLTHHSTTHDLVWHNDLPLLVMHQDDHYPPPPHATEAFVAHSL